MFTFCFISCRLYQSTFILLSVLLCRYCKASSLFCWAVLLLLLFFCVWLQCIVTGKRTVSMSASVIVYCSPLLEVETPRWPRGKASTSKLEWGASLCLRWSQKNDLNILFIVAAVPDAWHSNVSARTG